jgi:hypothetical protein
VTDEFLLYGLVKIHTCMLDTVRIGQASVELRNGSAILPVAHKLFPELFGVAERDDAIGEQSVMEGGRFLP